VIDDVPPADVDRVQADFKDSGALEVICEPKANGTWRVMAIFPT
jgi:hypothetical protein